MRLPLVPRCRGRRRGRGSRARCRAGAQAQQVGREYVRGQLEPGLARPAGRPASQPTTRSGRPASRSSIVPSRAQAQVAARDGPVEHAVAAQVAGARDVGPVSVPRISAMPTARRCPRGRRVAARARGSRAGTAARERAAAAATSSPATSDRRRRDAVGHEPDAGRRAARRHGLERERRDRLLGPSHSIQARAAGEVRADPGSVRAVERAASRGTRDGPRSGPSASKRRRAADQRGRARRRAPRRRRSPSRRPCTSARRAGRRRA